MPRKPSFKSLWTKSNIQQILNEHRLYTSITPDPFLCHRSPTFARIWALHKRALKRRAVKFSPENKHTHPNLLVSSLCTDDARIAHLTAFLLHELKSFN